MKTTSKNIWLSPSTDQVLLFKDHTGFYRGFNYQNPKTINSSVLGFNVYITNDEEIEFSDYYLDTLTNKVHLAKHSPVTMDCFKKIIMSSDFKLVPFLQGISIGFFDWFCAESNKNGNPIESVQIKKTIEIKPSGVLYECFIYEKEKTPWTQALNSHHKECSIKIMTVSVLNEDGTQTDITDKPRLWRGVDCSNSYSVVDESDSKKNNNTPLYSNYLMDNLQEIAENLVDRETNASIDSPYRKTLEKYVLLGLKSEEGRTTLDDMQYYMEYCQINPYVTPQEWLTNHKHY